MEVIVSILILTAAIIPMVGMFDMGLKTATTSGNYDKARAYANERLENAKSLSYANAESNSFPGGVTPTSCGSGCSRYDVPSASMPASAGLPNGSTYRIDKQYLTQPTVAPKVSSEDFSNSGVATDLMKVTVTVKWDGTGECNSGGTKCYSTSGVVGK